MDNDLTTILVLDDETPQIVTLRACLGELGKIVSFTEPFGALEFVKEKSVDVAIVDVHLPRSKMSGLDFMGEVRKFDSDLQFILRTGDDSGEVADGAIELKAFRRAIKGKTNVKELREITQAAIAETKSLRAKSRQAQQSEQISKQLEETLGVVEDELSAAESYKGLFHAMRNHLTALSSTAEYWCTAATDTDERQKGMSEKNRQIVNRMLSEMNSFLEGPFAEVYSAKAIHTHSDGNAALSGLRKIFSATTPWSAQFKTVTVAPLTDSLHVDAPAIKVLTSLRHVVEYCLQLALPKTTVSVRAKFTSDIDASLDEIPFEQLVFNRPVRPHAPGYVCFTFQNGPVTHSLEEIQKQFHEIPSDVRVGNLHILNFTLGADGYTASVYIDRSSTLTINLFLRAAT